MRTRPGWTLLELLLVVGVVGVIFTFALSYSRTPTLTLVEDQARRFAQELRSSRTEAIASAGQAWIEVEPVAGGARYRALLLAEGQDSTSALSAPWIELTGGVVMSPGTLAMGPLGDAALPLASRVRVLCAPTGTCTLGGAVARSFYFSHPSSPGIVRAVTLAEHGGVRSYRWRSAEGVWH